MEVKGRPIVKTFGSHWLLLYAWSSQRRNIRTEYKWKIAMELYLVLIGIYYNRFNFLLKKNSKCFKC